MTTPATPALSSRQVARLEGLAYARAWRAKNKPIFDAMFGEAVCGTCGARK